MKIKDTSTIPFLAENYSELVKYSDMIYWKYFWSISVPMTSSAKIFKILILPPDDQWGDFFEPRLVSKWSASYKLQNDVYHDHFLYSIEKVVILTTKSFIGPKYGFLWRYFKELYIFRISVLSASKWGITLDRKLVFHRKSYLAYRKNSISEPITWLINW